MFETLKPTPPDKIIAMMQQFRADPRADKIDLGVGVYKDAKGRTPVMHKIPLLGWLFKNDLANNQNNELLIFITPRILKS